jgi:hypothetical protein
MDPLDMSRLTVCVLTLGISAASGSFTASFLLVGVPGNG